MKRLLILGSAIAVLASAGVARAGLVGEYFGHLERDPSTQMVFDIDKVDGVRVVRHVVVWPGWSCHDGSQMRVSVSVIGRFPIENGEFHGTRDWVTKAASGDITLRGQKVDADTWRGTARAEGTFSLLPKTTCYTGKLRWRLNRVD